jgi:ABC-type phosphate transport system ATPase subunit
MDEPCSAQEPVDSAGIGRNLSKWNYVSEDGLKHPATIVSVTHNIPMLEHWDLVG